MSILDIEKLIASVDKKSGCVVLHDQAGDIKLIVPNGKMRVERLGTECSACLREGKAFAAKVSDALYVFDVDNIGKRKPKPVCKGLS